MNKPNTFLDSLIKYSKSDNLDTSDVLNIVDILSRADRNDFTSEAHYLYYKRYISPKISSVGKIRRLPNPGYYDKMLTKLSVGISESYVLLEFLNYEIYEDGEMRYSKSVTYLLGKNGGDGKVFVNKVDFRIASPIVIGRLEQFRLASDVIDGIVRVYKVSDSDIRNALGFNYDSDGEGSEVVIASEGSYRVQGEIILIAREIESEGRFRDYLRDSLRGDIFRYAEYLFRDHLIMILRNMGFNVDTMPNMNHLLHRGSEHQVVALLLGLKRALSLESKVSINENALNIESPWFGKVVVRVKTIGATYGDPYMTVYTSIYLEECGKLCSEIYMDLDRQVRLLKREDYEYVIGDHLVKIRNALTSRIVYTPPIKPMVLDSMNLWTSGDRFYVDQKSEITIAHQEHGVTKVRFARPFTIIITTTAVSPEFPIEMNRIALEILKRSLGKEYKDMVKEYKAKEQS